jgi:exonuclease SbcC
MIPLALRIKNFLSYGPELQTIDFGPYPLICLSGKNGHGKSALLDAITWALWGQARKTLAMIKPDQGLLRLGQTHMIVIFDFELADTAYRVRREFSLTYGKPHAQLEFGILNKETDTLISLSSKTIRTTQEVIERTIQIDFESFTNSAFLRQGNANEFSKKSSKDRKEILASILGLGHYDTLRKRATDKVKAAIAEKQTLLILQEKYTLELQKKELLATQLATVTHELNTIHAAEQTVDTQLANIEKQEKEHTQKQHDASLILFKQEELIKKQNEEKELVKNTYYAWRSTHKKQLRLPDYTLLQTHKQELTALLALFQKQLHDQLEAKKQQLEYTTMLNQHIQNISQEHAALLQNTIVERERVHVEIKNILTQEQHLLEQQKLCEAELMQTKNMLTKLGMPAPVLQSTDIQKLELLFERRKEYYHTFRTRGTLINAELQKHQHKKELVHDTQHTNCPLCEQQLSTTQRQLLEQKYTHQEQFLIHQRTRLLTVVKKLKELLIEQHAQIQKAHTVAQQEATRVLQRTELEKTITKLETSYTHILTELSTHTHKQQTLSHQLTNLNSTYERLEQEKQTKVTHDHRYNELVCHLHTIEHQLAHAPYEAHAHHATEKELANVTHKLTEYAHIQQEIAQQAQRKHEIFAACNALRARKKEISVRATEYALYTHIPELITALAQEKKTIIDMRKTYAHRKEQLLQEKGSIITQQEKLTALEHEYAHHERLIKNLEETITDYTSIATAVGKDGIQALLIEDAIPEIEQEANELLKKLTNNQAHIFIESLRDLKGGGTKETLDINISDATGIRPYELFSGGEAFRIDFALRIAISKLLARRAGTALQTLIIDEGFGSQDEEGLSHIMDALHAIQNEFSKVIIVSHLPAMKDQFPIHFVVEKGANGSTVTVLEQD